MRKAQKSKGKWPGWEAPGRSFTPQFTDIIQSTQSGAANAKEKRRTWNIALGPLSANLIIIRQQHVGMKIPRARNLHSTLKGNNGWKMSDETLGWRLSDGQACLQIQRRPISHGAAVSPKWLPRSKQWLVLREESAWSVKYFIFNTQVWKMMYTFLHFPKSRYKRFCDNYVSDLFWAGLKDC